MLFEIEIMRMNEPRQVDNVHECGMLTMNAVMKLWNV